MSAVPIEKAAESPVSTSRSDVVYRLSILLAALLVLPAFVLVADGNLSVNGALGRFACALVAAAGGVAVLRACLPAEQGDRMGAALSDEPAGERQPG